MAVIWGTNYSIAKSAFSQLDPQAFNAARMIVASSVFLILIALLRLRPVEPPTPGRLSLASVFRTPAPITRRDWLELAGLGVVGHFCYQYFFIGGLARTTVANSSLMLAATPILIALLSAALGLERVGPRHWAGAALSMLGIYVVVGHGARFGADGLTGDLMMLAAVLCWALYTLGARRIVVRHSPVAVTGLSMAFGAALYVPFTSASVRAADWQALPAMVWVTIAYSSLFALCLAYTIWYAAVRQIGSARTSLYSNLVPIVAMTAAVLFLGEPIDPVKIAGAGLVIAGVLLARTRPEVCT